MSAAVVLTYHRVAGGRDPLQQCVSPENFADQLRQLRDVADIVPLTEIRDRGPRDRIALTFDDGYADNAHTAAPILAVAGAAATFFVTSRVLDPPAEYWWDQLEHQLLDRESAVPQLDVDIDGRRVRIDVRDEAGRQRALKVLNRRLRVLPYSAIAPVLAAVTAQVGAAPAPTCPNHALVDAGALSRLASDTRFAIGSHAATHTMLSALEPLEQEAELRESRTRLSEATKTSVTALAYPFGTSESYSTQTVRAAAAAGYELACANEPGRITARSDRYRLPRHMVYDWDGPTFAIRVAEMLNRAR